MEETVGLVRLGEGHLPVLVGVGDLYLELISVGVRGRRVAADALFLSDGSRRRLVVIVSVATSIQRFLMEQTLPLVSFCIHWSRTIVTALSGM